MNIAKYQNQWNLEQWNRENEYNTPSAQLARLKNAGLNPNLIYGNGSAVTTSASSPRASGAQFQNENTGLSQGVSGALALAMNVLMQQQEMNKVSAQSDLLREQKELAILNQNYVSANTLRSGAQTEYYNTSAGLNKSRTEMLTHQIENIDANTLLTYAKAHGQGIYNNNAEQMYAERLRLLRSQGDLNNAQINSLTQKIAQAWLALDIQERDFSRRNVNTKWQNTLISESINKIAVGTSIDIIKRDILSETSDYRHVNAFFGALDQATKFIKP